MPEGVHERAPVQVAVHVFSRTAAARVDVIIGERSAASRKVNLRLETTAFL